MRFTNVPDEGLRVELERDEAELLRRLIAELRLLLEAEVPDSDIVKKRLFPPAYEVQENAAEFHSLVADDLRAVKAEALRSVSERLGPNGPLLSSIPPEETTAWLILLTDLRLAIGTRLDVDEKAMERELDPEDPDAAAMSVMHWLGWVQESMLAALGQPQPGGSD